MRLCALWKTVFKQTAEGGINSSVNCVLGVPVLGNEVSFDTEASIGADSGVPIEDCAELVPPETRDENSSLKECEKEVI